MSGLLRRATGVVAVVLVVATQASAASGADSTPDPSTARKCPGEESLETLPERGSLAIDGLVALPIPPSGSGRRDYQDVELSWFALAQEDVCVAVFLEPNPGTAVFGDSAWARLFQPGDVWLHQDIEVGGRHCYRVVVVLPDARGPVEEVCAEVRELAGDDDRLLSLPVLVGGAAALLGLAAVLLLVRRRALAER